jgi:DNA-binding SARP family transcriptional activator
MVSDTVTIRLLGAFAIEIDGRTVPDAAWRHQRAADLVKILALAPGHRLTRDQVIDTLWPSLSPTAGGANVRKAAHRARQATGEPGVIGIGGGMVVLGPGRRVETDVARFESALDRAESGGGPGAFRVAVSLYRGDLLPDDRYAEWSGSRRDRLRWRYTRALAGAGMWGRLVDVDPIDERAHREIMRGHLQNGDRAAALRQYEVLRETLRDELGVAPSPESVQLYESALSMDGPETPTPAERARALLAWGVVHWERADLGEARRAAAEARALALDAGLGRELSDASELLGIVAYAQGAWQEVFGRELVETFEHAPDMTPFVFDAHMCMSEFALCEPDGVQAVGELSADIMAAADRSCSVQGEALGLLLRGEAALLGDSDLRRARRDLERASRLHEEAGSLTGLAIARERLAQLESVEGDERAARHLHETALEVARRSPVPKHLLLFVYGGMLADADGDGAPRLIDAGESATAGMQVCDPCAMAFRLEAAKARAVAGRPEEARRYLAQAERVSTMWPGGPWHSAVEEARSLVLLHGGAPAAQAADLLESAAAGFADAARPRDEARCRRAAAALRPGTAGERSPRTFR